MHASPNDSIHPPSIPNDYRRLFLSLFLLSNPSCPLPSSNMLPTPLAFSTSSPLHLPSTVVDPWVFWPLGTISNLETRHGVLYRRLYVVVETIEREEVSLLSLSLSDQDANKSSQTNIKWQRGPRRIYTIFSKVRALREMIDATHFHA